MGWQQQAKKSSPGAGPLAPNRPTRRLQRPLARRLCCCGQPRVCRKNPLDWRLPSVARTCRLSRTAGRFPILSARSRLPLHWDAACPCCLESSSEPTRSSSKALRVTSRPGDRRSHCRFHRPASRPGFSCTDDWCAATVTVFAIMAHTRFSGIPRFLPRKPHAPIFRRTNLIASAGRA